MVRRTRRNLSDPRIKKIVKAQTVNGKAAAKKSLQHPDNQSGSRTAFRIFMVIGLGVICFALYSNWTVIDRFINQTLLSSFNTESTNAAPPRDLTPTLSQMQGAADQPATTADDAAATVEETESATNDAEQATVNSGADDSQEKLVPVERRIQVEVLNGCGVNGLAEKFTNYLRQKNIDVVSRGNYKNFRVKKSLILDRIEDADKSQEIASALGINSAQISLEKDESLQLDATIVLGADYKRLKPFTN